MEGENKSAPPEAEIKLNVEKEDCAAKIQSAFHGKIIKKGEDVC
jgi:hypothetical protein